MEKLNISLDYISQRKKQAVKELLEDEDVQMLLKQRGLKESDVQNHFIAFSNWLEQYKICKNCKGLFMCSRKDIVGYHYDLDSDCNEIYKACKYKIQEEKLYAHKSNYLICDLSDQNLLNDINLIDLTGEKEYYRVVVGVCKDWLKTMPSKGLYLHGNLGVGKTYLLACVCNYLARNGYKVAYVNVPNLIVDLKNNLLEKDYIDEKLDKMKKAYLLVLDDIGAEKSTIWSRDEILFPVLDYRMERHKRTMFASNCSLDELEERMKLTSDGKEDISNAARLIHRIKVLSKDLTVVGTTRRLL